MHRQEGNYFMHGKPPQLTGNEHSNLVPYAIFPTRTDNIFIGVGNDGTFRKLAREIGKPELGTDPRFARNKDRIANRDALRAELAAVFSQHDAGPLCDRLLAAAVAAGCAAVAAWCAADPGPSKAAFALVPALRSSVRTLHRVRDTRFPPPPIFHFPWPALPPYHPLVDAVIRTSSGAANAPQ